ncbi:hypothetical protein HOL21_01925 [Candidatus Woesearchaeota archaeon]|jgi:hypothetical protein|nr:hypothetical protein [Candidatus Woesearchaeota archaeon]MBT5396951.1 hypothetical protein [Candidatus Woesearchaeota archaeon]MBT5924769.1 hypothetical protein [Candidatus Woesearchaeota archaeon]MBT6367144.1 hypothetical protein [Candidatus Woesearchaeota archaeon]MBT7762282.1 hypothetical protein [Candidatus Woesearchaeota archaeon]
MIELLFSLTGIVFGYILACIAPEELDVGKKYFVIGQHVLYTLIVILSGYYIFQISSIACIVWILVAITFFILKMKLKNKYTEVGSYIIFAVPYFINADRTFQLLLITLIFLYGFPFGTLIKIQ